MLVPMVGATGEAIELEDDSVRFLEEHLHLVTMQTAERQQGRNGVPIGLCFRPGTGRERLARMGVIMN